VDKQVLLAAGSPDPSMSERERLFEILMERFDILNKDREAVRSMLHSALRDPAQGAISLPHLGRSMAWMLEAAGIAAGGIRGAAKILCLSGVYIYCLRCWMKDDTADLSKTMAAVDRALGQVENIAGRLRF
jgi:hypothetical protein